MAFSSLRFWTPPLLVAVIALTPSPMADAASSVYRVNGQIGSLDTPSVLDGGSFSLRLGFEEPAVADPALSTILAEVFGFSADTWSLDLFDAGGAATQSYNYEAQPGALGFVVLTGEITGFDSARTLIDVGVDADAAPRPEDRGATLIELEFFVSGLVDALLGDDLAALPAGLGFRGGSVLELESGLRLPVVSAELTTLSLVGLESGPSDGGDGTGGGGAAAVPSPTAAAGGMLLFLGILVARNPRLQRLADADRF